MLSMRTLILAGLTVYLLPKEPEQQRQFEATARQAYAWASSLCVRHEAHCARAGVIAADLKERAAFGLSLVYQLAVGGGAEDDAPISSRPRQVRPTHHWQTSQAIPDAEDQAARGTLTAADVAPSWRGAFASDEPR